LKMADESDTPEVSELKQKINKWLDEHKNVLELNIRETSPNHGLVGYYSVIGQTQNFTQCGTAPDSLFIHSADNMYFNIGFAEKISRTDSVDTLRKQFQFVALDKLPMPDLQAPSNWIITPQTPISSFSDGVTIESFENGRIRYHIDTNFFAVYGNIPQEHPIMDAPSPPGTYLQVRRNFQGKITIDMPMFAT
ncbi:unnamed protein product, partial [Didymodactylos carnosus]